MKNAVGLHEVGAVVASIVAAIQCGVLDALVEGPCETGALAARTGTSPLALDRVLAVLAAAGLVTRTDGRVALSADAVADAEVAPGGLVGVARLFANVPGFLREGARIGKMDGATIERGQAYAPAVRDLGRLFAEPAAALARALPAPRHVLDVGAGSGVWSLAMIEGEVTGRVTALDLPPVLPSFVDRATRLGLDGRIDVIAGDFHDAPLPAAHFDRVVLANVLHLETEARAAALVARAASALAPGGSLVIVDVFPIGPSGALGHAAYELHLAMRTSGGRAHAEERIATWCRSAGLAPRAPFPLAGRIHGLGALVAASE